MEIFNCAEDSTTKKPTQSLSQLVLALINHNILQSHLKLSKTRKVVLKY